LGAQLFSASQQGAQEQVSRSGLGLYINEQLQGAFGVYLLLHVEDDIGNAHLNKLLIGREKNIVCGDTLKRGAGV
jgi:hypothetical protein